MKYNAEEFYPTPERLLDKITLGIEWKMLGSILEPSAGIKVEYIRKGEVVLNGKRYSPVYMENTMRWEPMGWQYEGGQNYITFTGYDISPLVRYLTKERGKNGLPLEDAVEECFGEHTPENYEKYVRLVASLGTMGIIPSYEVDRIISQMDEISGQEG